MQPRPRPARDRGMKTYGPFNHRTYGYEILTPVRILKLEKSDIKTLSPQQRAYLTRVRKGYVVPGFDEVFAKCRKHLDRLFD
jgi:hypothetical protein